MARKGTKVFLVVAGVGILLAGLWGTAFLISGFGSDRTLSGPDSYEERVLIEGDSAEKIAMINVVGEIYSDPAGTDRGATDTSIVEQIDKALEDDDVKAIILNVDTPGGGVVASDNIHSKVREADDEKPVVALMNDLAASGGYYVSVGAREIVAHPSTWTGSIGVIAMIPNLEQAASKVGIGMNVVKSGALKDLGSPFREMTEQERAVFQALIDEAYAGFVEVVAEGREIEESRVRELADGRIYSGRQALELGLIDTLGDRQTAFERAKELGKTDDPALVLYEQPAGIFEGLFPFGQAQSAVEKIGEELGIDRDAGPAYLWIP